MPVAMSIRHLRTLIAVAEHGSFAAAAEAVCLTQSAVSQQMKALEDAFGVNFFDRNQRPLEVNARGRALIQQARQLVYLYDQLLDQGEEGSSLVGLLEIGAVPTALTSIIPRALVRLRETQATLQVRVSSGLSAELMAKVDRGDLDAAIVSEPKPVPSGMLWRPVADEPLMVIAPKSSEISGASELLRSMPFIRFNRSAWVGHIIQTRLQDMNIQVREAMELDSLEAIRQMVRHGLGVSIVPYRCAESSDAEELRWVPFGDHPIHRTIGLIERQQNLKTGLTTALFNELTAVAAAGRNAIDRLI
ncbi:MULTISPECIES: LysR family transcriptional regulator [Pseudomonadaceae]|uniref:LysR family transcriptional regulator n=1 Tax=Pseudomonadaceae TaxID=135621 RepID=UPI0015E635AC|nr:MULTISPECIES: LysR family transcriptional regulator [Pseudomonadaceae]